MLKATIIVLFIAVLVSLASSLGFLFRDQNTPGSRRALHALGIRIILASLLIGFIFYGLATGKLTLNAPWHQKTRLMSDQINKSEKPEPDYINEMPVPGNRLKAKLIVGIKVPAQTSHRNHD